MFEPCKNSRVFGCAPGADFPKMLVDGLIARFVDQPPERLALVEVYVNTRRMQRRILRLFDQGPALLLPRIRLVTDLANDPGQVEIPPAVSLLRRRLELSQFVAKLLDQEPDLAPRSSIFDLSDSLALLLAEMHDENVSPDTVLELDISDRSGHWQRSQKFLRIVSHFFDLSTGAVPDQTARQRRVVEQLALNWTQNPPTHPVIIAGSTGSRGSTSLLMQVVSRLPQGAVILPGFDFELPQNVWDRLDNAMISEDHPQFRFAHFLKVCDSSVSDVVPWIKDALPPNVNRNRLVSLALRPAPVTSQWLVEGPALTHIKEATQAIALIEAPSERVESMAIAMALRDAAHEGLSAALVTPDRLLTRRVAAALDRWGIEPDISAGIALDQTTPGRLLRHVSDLFSRRLTSEALLILLKHPLVNSAENARGQHLRWTRDLELKIRKSGPVFPTTDDILNWAENGQENPERAIWAHWVCDTVFGLEISDHRPVTVQLRNHLTVTQALAVGPDASGSAHLWDGAAGKEMRRVVEELEREAHYAGSMVPADYSALFHAVLKRADVRDPVRPHQNIMIWGTLEARVQGADLVILGGLNDGTWPELAAPDPWLNREMRHKSGLLLPERRIGLSAHDFQQAIAAKSVILTRSVRNAEAQTVPSRWLNRLTNLMAGMSKEGDQALDDMRKRGHNWLAMVEQLEKPVPVTPEPRPAPKPPLEARPKSLSVTAVSRLIRDPYAIYAQYILRLKSLGPLRKTPDAPLRGTVLHKIFETFIQEANVENDVAPLGNQLLDIADQVFATDAPWPAASALWRAKLARVTDWFLTDEQLRQQRATPVALEVQGGLWLADLDFTLTAKADRIDRTPDGLYLIYDYKTGSVPKEKQLRHFDKQLLLEAVMVEQGAFKILEPGIVREVAHIGLGSSPKFTPVLLEPDETRKIHSELVELILRFQSRDQGYTSRRAMEDTRFDGDFDHLARFGEWDETQTPEPQEVGK